MPVDPNRQERKKVPTLRDRIREDLRSRPMDFDPTAPQEGDWTGLRRLNYTESPQAIRAEEWKNELMARRLKSAPGDYDPGQEGVSTWDELRLRRLWREERESRIETERQRLHGADIKPLSERWKEYDPQTGEGWDAGSAAQFTLGVVANVAMAVPATLWGTASTVSKIIDYIPRMIGRELTMENAIRDVESGKYESLEEAFNARWKSPIGAIAEFSDKQLGQIGEARDEIMRMQGELISERFNVPGAVGRGVAPQQAVTMMADMAVRIKTLQAITKFKFGGESSLPAQSVMTLKLSRLLGLTSDKANKAMMGLDTLNKSIDAARKVSTMNAGQQMIAQALSVAKSAPILAAMSPQQGVEFNPFEFGKSVGRSSAFLGTTVFSPLAGAMAVPTDILGNTVVSVAFDEFRESEQRAYDHARSLGFDEETALSMAQMAYWSVHVMNVYYGSKTRGFKGQRVDAQNRLKVLTHQRETITSTHADMDRVVKNSANELKAAKLYANENEITQLENDAREGDPIAQSRIETLRNEIEHTTAQDAKSVLAELIALSDDGKPTSESVDKATRAMNDMVRQADILETKLAAGFGGDRESLARREREIKEMVGGGNLKELPNFAKNITEGGERTRKAWSGFESKLVTNLRERANELREAGNKKGAANLARKATNVEKGGVKPELVAKYAIELAGDSNNKLNAMLHNELRDIRLQLLDDLTNKLNRDTARVKRMEEDAPRQITSLREGADIIRNAIPQLGKDVDAARARIEAEEAIRRNRIQDHTVGKYQSFEKLDVNEAETYAMLRPKLDQIRDELGSDAPREAIAAAFAEVVRTEFGAAGEGMPQGVRDILDRLMTEPERVEAEPVKATEERIAEPEKVEPELVRPQNVAVAKQFARHMKERQAGGEAMPTPLIDAIEGFGKIREFKRLKADTKKRGGEYDDTEGIQYGDLPKHIRYRIYPKKVRGGERGLPVDEVAKYLFEEVGILPDGYASTLWAKLREEIGTIERSLYPEGWSAKEVRSFKQAMAKVEQGKPLTELQKAAFAKAVDSGYDLQYKESGIEVPQWAREGREPNLQERKEDADNNYYKVSANEIEDGDLVWRDGEWYVAKADSDDVPFARQVDLVDGKEITVIDDEVVPNATMIISKSDPNFPEAFREFQQKHPKEADTLKLETLTLEEQAALDQRLAEQKARGAAQDEAAQKQVGRLTGGTGDLGQRDMFGQDEDLFATAAGARADAERVAEPAVKPDEPVSLAPERLMQFMDDVNNARADFNLSQHEKRVRINLPQNAQAIESNTKILSENIKTFHEGVTELAEGILKDFNLDETDDRAIWENKWARQRVHIDKNVKVPPLSSRQQTLADEMDRRINEVFEAINAQRVEAGMLPIKRERDYFPLVTKGQIVGEAALGSALHTKNLLEWLEITENPFLFHERQEGVRDRQFYRRSSMQNFRDYLYASYAYLGMNDKAGFGYQIKSAIQDLNMKTTSPDVIDARAAWHKAQRERGENAEPRDMMEANGKAIDEHIDTIQNTLKDAGVDASKLQIPDVNTNDRLAEHSSWRRDGRLHGITGLDREWRNPWLLMLKIDGLDMKTKEFGPNMKLWFDIQTGVAGMEAQREKFLAPITGENGIFQQKYGSRGLGLLENKRLNKRLTAVWRYFEKEGFDGTERSAEEFAETIANSSGRDVQTRDIEVYNMMRSHLQRLYVDHAEDLRRMSSLRGVAYRSPVMGREKANRSFFDAYEVLMNRVSHASTQSKNIVSLLAIANFYNRAGASGKDANLKEVGKFWEEFAEVGLAHGLHAWDRSISNLGASDRRNAMIHERSLWKNLKERPGDALLEVLHRSNQLLPTMFLKGAVKWTLRTQWTSLAIVPQHTGMINFAKSIGRNLSLMLQDKLVKPEPTPYIFTGERYRGSVSQRIKHGSEFGGIAAREADYRYTKLVQGYMQRVDGFANKLAEQVEYATGAAAYQAAAYEAQRVGMTGERAEYFKNSVVATTQSMYNRESRSLILNSIAFRAAFPFQTFAVDAFSGLIETVSNRTGDKGVAERVAGVGRLLSAIYLTNLLSEMLFKRKAFRTIDVAGFDTSIPDLSQLIPVAGMDARGYRKKEEGVTGLLKEHLPVIDFTRRTLIEGVVEWGRDGDPSKLARELPGWMMALGGLPSASMSRDAIHAAQTIRNHGYVLGGPNELYGTRSINTRDYLMMSRDIAQWVFARTAKTTTTALEEQENKFEE
jgi:hypothetical protein